VKQQLQADVIAPAEAQSKQAIAQAQGNAAKILEDGKARAEGTLRLAESWRDAGSNARDIYLLQRLETLLKTLTAAVPDVTVQNVTLVDSSNSNTATQLATFIEQIRQTTGIDLAETVQNLSYSQQKQLPSESGER